ncbi:MAG: type II toxin-antitoxin system RelB/DinJ family antitoxin [Oscillospiraceae bacterium]|jgi:DNA-damage-inducible protein J|nr:type II toxin-antitoxin system RelB/DinJ family antitoxin [Oscillospiraceae bacterium]
MANTVNVTIRMDREVKEGLEMLLEELGMNLSTAMNVFARQTLREGKIPFIVGDPFWDEKNQERLNRSIADAEAGKYAAHELAEDD